MDKIINKKSNFSGVYSVPSDKSISHRAVMIASIAEGVTRIENFLIGEDCVSTINCFRELGVDITVDGTTVTVTGKGLRGLTKPPKTLYVGNSGTSIRLMCGLLSGQDFSCVISGDESIKNRPMERVIMPLTQMGARIEGLLNNGKVCAPLEITGGNLKGISYTLPVASAQVKSAILFASLYANGETIINEPIKTRNHTELMLNHFGANITITDDSIRSKPVKNLHAQDIFVPGDISSAAYLIVAALTTPGSNITIKNVCVNKTRTGIIDVLTSMGAHIKTSNIRHTCGEETGDITVQHSALNGVEIGKEIMGRLIDEIPVIAAAACHAKGTTTIKDAHELKHKETDRIKATVTELKKMGANITETSDGMIIQGGNPLTGQEVESYADHRIAMSLAVAGLTAQGATTIKNAECTNISFPNFFELLERL